MTYKSAHRTWESVLNKVLFPPNFLASGTSVVSKNDFEDMKRIVALVDHIQAREAYQKYIQDACQIPLVSQTKGVFTAFDFMVTEKGIRLIEINTNGGGVLASLVVCSRVQANPEKALADCLDQIKAMFLLEYERSLVGAPLKRIAIMDAEPEKQPLYFEFLGLRDLFQAMGFETVVVDPSQLDYDATENIMKTGGGAPIQMVYNRHCDFYLEGSDVTHIKSAYQNRAICLTPGPMDYATLADKDRLINLSDTTFLQKIGLNIDEQSFIEQIVPPVTHIQQMDSEVVHQTKNDFYFKPAKLYGSKGVYSGKKISRKKLNEILTQDYVVQKVFEPKRVSVSGIEKPFKEEIRVFTYDGKIQFMSARHYQGQTSNMNTVGGGFASVVVSKTV